MDHWTDRLLENWHVPIIIALALATAWSVVLVVRHCLRDRPRARTSAMSRLIERNPSIIFDGARWTLAAQRVRTGWVTAVAVAVAVLIVADRPTRVVN